MPVYNRSDVQDVIIITLGVKVTLTIAFYGSADGYTNPGKEFGDDETILVGGTVRADDGAELTGIPLDVTVDGSAYGTAVIYGYSAGVNYYQRSLGVLTQGSHTVSVVFPRTRR